MASARQSKKVTTKVVRNPRRTKTVIINTNGSSKTKNNRRTKISTK